MKTRKALIIGGSIVATAAIGYLIYQMFFNRKSKLYLIRSEKEDDSILFDVPGTSSGTSSGGSTTPPLASCPYPPTPFKNEEEGDAFRYWVNVNYTSVAEEIDLDPSGKFNNCYIRKAHAYKVAGGRTLGNIYATIDSTDTAPTTTDETVFDKLISRLNKLNAKYIKDSGKLRLQYKTLNTKYDANKFRYQFYFYSDGSWAMYWKNASDSTFTKAVTGKYTFNGDAIKMTIKSGQKSFSGKSIGGRSTTHTYTTTAPKVIIDIYNDDKLGNELTNSFFAY
jgi:hypothetical protein